MIENLDHVGGAWGPKKAWQLDLLVKHAGQNGDKLSMARLAKKAKVSTEFLASLRGYDVRYRGGTKHYANRERVTVTRVLEALGVTEKEFLDQAAGRLH